MIRTWVSEAETLVRDEIKQSGFTFRWLGESDKHDLPRSELRAPYICLLQRADNCIMEFLVRRSRSGESCKVAQVVVAQATCKD